MAPRTLIVETDRLLLTKPGPEDVGAVFAVHGDSATNRHNPHGPHRSPDESLTLLEEMIADWNRDGIGYFAVTLREDPAAVIGFAGTRFKHLNGERVFNLYYRFTPSTWGRGLAHEATRAALDFASLLFPDVPVVALIREDNLSSRRLAERLGLRLLQGEKDPEGRSIYIRRPSHPSRPGQPPTPSESKQ